MGFTEYQPVPKCQSQFCYGQALRVLWQWHGYPVGQLPTTRTSCGPRSNFPPGTFPKADCPMSITTRACGEYNIQHFPKIWEGSVPYFKGLDISKASCRFGGRLGNPEGHVAALSCESSVVLLFHMRSIIYGREPYDLSLTS